MAKKSSKQSAQRSGGCMSGLISMFDFRQGQFTQKLLSNRKHENSQYKGNRHSRSKIDGQRNLEEMLENVSHNDPKEVARDKLGMANVKELMIMETSKAHTTKNIPNSKVEKLRAELGFGANIDNNHERRANQKLRFRNDYDINELRDPLSTCSDPSESSSFDVNLADLMVEFSRENHKCQEMHICDGMKDLSIRKSNDWNRITTHEFMDALQTCSNKDKFLKLLQDRPYSLLFKHNLDLQNAHASGILHGSKPEESISCQQPRKKNECHLFRKKEKSDESSSQTSERIVLLKPRCDGHLNTISPTSAPKWFHNLRRQEGTERVSPHFSLTEIKSRLRNVVGKSQKERDSIAMDGVLHKIPYGFQNLVGKNGSPSTTKQSTKLYSFLEIEDDDANIQLSTESVFYEEAKKQLAEMLSADACNEVSSPRRSPKSLGRILSLPGYGSLSPRFSPQIDIDKGSSTLSIETSACSDSNSNSNPTLMEVLLDTEKDLIQEVSDIRVELTTDEFGCTSERCNEEGSPMISDSLGTSEENLDRPSPVSVLDSFFSEDFNRLEKMETRCDVLIPESRKLSFEEQISTVSEANLSTTFKYVQTVLQASGLNYNELLERWKLSDQLLDQFVFEEVEILYGQLIDDSKLLFDCIDEVLVDICERDFICSSWISAIKQNIRPAPNAENFVDEVYEGVNQYLHVKEFRYTLDQIARKDLECGAWTNVRFDIEGAVVEIEEVILDFVMEETILELWE